MANRLKTRIGGLKLRWKLLLAVLPMVILPIVITGSLVGYISARQAYQGITERSEADLDHMAAFSADLLEAHHQQFQVYRADKRRNFRRDLKTLTDAAFEIVETAQQQFGEDKGQQIAQQNARKTLRRINVGESGYVFVLDSSGLLHLHIAREGDNIIDSRDENGRLFIRELIETAKQAGPDKVNFITYPWSSNLSPADHPRLKIAAYRYFPAWDWIIAVSGYLDETYDDLAFEERAFAKLKEQIKSKQVGKTGYIYAMTTDGTFTIHPENEGQNFIDARDSSGNYFIREMCEKKNGWIRYPWKNDFDPRPRMKIARYRYVEALNWIVAVGSYEDEFYDAANRIKGRSFISMLILTVLMTCLLVPLVIWATRLLTRPVARMMEAIRQVKSGNFAVRVSATRRDELGEMAQAFNRMIGMIDNNREIEMKLAHQEKMASLGVLSSGVAHEINNPLGVILGYAAYLENKLETDSPYYNYVHEIKRESKRCKKIVQDLLSYARMPKPTLREEDVNELLRQIAAFAANHTELHSVNFKIDLDETLPPLAIDGDLFRQITINLILNAGNAMEGHGLLTIRTSREEQTLLLEVSDTGCGIPAEHLDNIFEPFFTTREQGTGLGLAITKQIVDMHHGSIEVSSTPGKGTTFRIRLPLNQEESL
ncbi:MAG: cache domain-containing protein [Desulfuromonadaceae bacterium]|nr:cache domain-containing protein [Desulfuromonadaceae bacterium]